MSDKNKESKFINPLLRATLPKEQEQEKVQEANEANLEAISNDATPSPILPVDPPTDTIRSFESKHERFTTWIDKNLKKRFDKLAKRQGKGAKTRLMNEALSDLIKKYEL